MKKHRDSKNDWRDSCEIKMTVILQAFPILGQIKDISVQAPHLWPCGGCHIWLNASGLTLIIVQRITQTVAAF